MINKLFASTVIENEVFVMISRSADLTPTENGLAFY